MIEAASHHAAALTEAAAETGVEAALVARAARGDTAAFHLLVERHQADVFRCCRHWLGNAEDAQEACQDCFVRAWQALPDYRHQGRLRAWLLRIALNLCRDRTRSRGAGEARLTVSLAPDLPEPACAAPRPDEVSGWRSEMEKLERGLRALPESLRLPLTLCALEGLSQEECGEVLGLSARAVEGRVRRGRQALLAWWEKEECGRPHSSS